MVKELLWIFFIFYFSNTAVSDVIQIEPSTDKRKYFLTETINYSIKIPGENLETIRIKEIPDFEIIKQHSEMIGGNSIFKFVDNKLIHSSMPSIVGVLRLVLKPIKIGSITIGKILIKKNGKEYFIKPIKIFVAEKKKNDVNKIGRTEKNSNLIDNELFLETKFSDKSCYIQEPIFIEYRLYHRKPLKFMEPPELPEIKGFQLDAVIDFRDKKKIAGKEYSLYVIRQYLFPLIEGKLRIKEGNFKILRDYDSLINNGEPVLLKPGNIEIEVNPITNKPQDFYGTTAKKHILSIAYIPDTIAENSVFSCSFVLIGSYNQRLCNEIKPEPTSGIELITSSETAVVTADSTGYNCVKTYLFVFAAKGAGEFFFKTKRITYYSVSDNKFLPIEYAKKIIIEKRNNFLSASNSMINQKNNNKSFNRSNSESLIKIPKLFVKNKIAFFIITVLFIILLLLKENVLECFFSLTKKIKRLKLYFTTLRKLKQLKIKAEINFDSSKYSELQKIICGYIKVITQFNGMELSNSDIKIYFFQLNLDENIKYSQLPNEKNKFLQIEFLEDIDKILNYFTKYSWNL